MRNLKTILLGAGMGQPLIQQLMERRLNCLHSPIKKEWKSV